jgi:hypothetical protein
MRQNEIKPRMPGKKAMVDYHWNEQEIRRWLCWRESVRGEYLHSHEVICRYMGEERQLPFETLWLFHISIRGKVIRKQLCAVGNDRECIIN